MPLPRSGKEISSNDNECAQLFSRDDPEKLFVDLREIGHGNFGAVYYVCLDECVHLVFHYFDFIL